MGSAVLDQMQELTRKEKKRRKKLAKKGVDVGELGRVEFRASDLATAMGRTTGSLIGSLNLLEKKGLVRRRKEGKDRLAPVWWSVKKAKEGNGKVGGKKEKVVVVEVESEDG